MKLLEHTISLLVVFLLLTATAVWSGSLFGRPIGGTDRSVSSSAVAAPDDETLEALRLSPKAITLAAVDSAAWNVTDTSGTHLGQVVSTAPYAPEVQGFAGPTPLYIYIGADGTVKELAAAPNGETASFFQNAFDGLTPSWKGLSLKEATEAEPDGISGATYSSRSILQNVHATLSARSEAADKADSSAPAIGWGRTAAVAFVLLFGIIIAWRYRGVKPLRLVVLLLNVAVLGFWCGQYLSVSLLRGWITSGVDPLLYLPTVLVLLTALLLPLFGRKRHYCNWVCPYGSLQELVGRLPVPKIPVSPKAFRVMSKIRFGVLITLLFYLYIGFAHHFTVLDYEPFSAFQPSAAPLAVIILAGSFVVLSMFVPKLWCRCFCPLGSLLDLSEETVKKSAPNRNQSSRNEQV